MIEVGIFTVVVAHPEAPSVVVLAEKGAFPHALTPPDAFQEMRDSLMETATKARSAEGVSLLGDEGFPASGTEDTAVAGSMESAAGAGGADASGAGGTAPDAEEASFDTEKAAVPDAERTAADTAGAADASSTANTDESIRSEHGSTLEPQLLPIWIGHSEAEAIMILLENQTHTRPFTHELLANVIGALGSKVESIIIDKVMDSTFFANICLDKDGRKIRIDARPSDSIALALRTGARIYVDEDVMNAAARQFRLKVSDGGELLYGSDDEMERFHSFIESVSPEDFTL